MTPLLILISLMINPTDTTMQNFIPSSIEQWDKLEPTRFYSGDQIFDYMDGAGEVYLCYNFKDLLVQRYTASDKSEILLEIFDMDFPQNAFGIYTYMQGRGPRVDIGQEGEYKAGLLCFWKDKYFTCIKIDDETESAAKAVMKLGKYISDKIDQIGAKPDIIRFLPEEMYSKNSLRYLFRHEILNNHFYLSSANILNINNKTECVLVRSEQDKSYLLLVQYAEKVQADSAYDSFNSHYMPDARETGVVQTENNKWTTCKKHKYFIIIVFDAETKSQGINTIEIIIRRLP